MWFSMEEVGLLYVVLVVDDWLDYNYCIFNVNNMVNFD